MTLDDGVEPRAGPNVQDAGTVSDTGGEFRTRCQELVRRYSNVDASSAERSGELRKIDVSLFREAGSIRGVGGEMRSLEMEADSRNE